MRRAPELHMHYAPRRIPNHNLVHAVISGLAMAAFVVVGLVWIAA